ncbi:BA75_01446T0 [Komagataella pastoris]|uniref:BA75_01446T0 n=1 Tax=Komagataella pastoris TaxID=4922 RepID=A0A1B2J5Y0_PICPA|nr:BA75_01446T0 [Komagataella pastoris]
MILNDYQATSSTTVVTVKTGNDNLGVHVKVLKAPIADKVQKSEQIQSVDSVSLVHAAAIMLQLNWPWQVYQSYDSKLRGLQFFITEVLKRTKANIGVLEVALYYIHKLSLKNTKIRCAKRIFLSCLMLSYKFTQDKNYTANTWSRVSGLSVKELMQNEIAILVDLEYKLFIDLESFSKWKEALQGLAYGAPKSKMISLASGLAPSNIPPSLSCSDDESDSTMEPISLKRRVHEMSLPTQPTKRVHLS